MASIASDDLGFFFRNILVNMLEDETLEVRIDVAECKQGINMVPVVGEQATQCVTVFFFQVARVALPESFESIMQPLPVNYVAHFTLGLFHFRGKACFSALSSAVWDGSRYDPGERKKREWLWITAHEDQYRIPTETFTN
jgi:hypothetical protein